MITLATNSDRAVERGVGQASEDFFDSIAALLDRRGLDDLRRHAGDGCSRRNGMEYDRASRDSRVRSHFDVSQDLGAGPDDRAAPYLRASCSLYAHAPPRRPSR
jgi:hypothetical protein